MFEIPQAQTDLEHDQYVRVPASASIPGDPAEMLRVMSRAGVPCLLLGQNGAILDASDALDPSVQEFRGRDVAEAYGLGTALTMGNGAVDGIYQARDGAPVPAQLVPLCKLESGELVVLVNDGTPFRKAESRRFERTPYAVFRLDLEGVVRFANREAARALGQKLDEVCGEPLARHFRKSDAPRIADAIRCCARNQEGDSMVAVIVAMPGRDGEERLFQLVMTPDPAPNGELLGVIAIIQSRALESARDEIRRIALDPAISGWRLKLDAILEQIRPLVPFEHAVFGIYDAQVSLFRAIAVRPEGVELWPARWMELPPAIRPFLDSGQTWIEEMEPFVSGHDFEPGDEIVRRYRDMGMQASVTLPVTRQGGYSSALSLCSRQPAQYGQRHLDILRALDLEPVLMRFEKERDDERTLFAESLRQTIMTADSLRTAARDIVPRLAQFFSWDYVALFRVNRKESRYEIVTQHSLAPEYALPDGYLQPIECGMLGQTLRQRQLLSLDDVGDADDPRNDYTGPPRPLRSAMTVPIRLNGRIRWLLDVESSVSHAFKGPDADDLLEIIASLEEGLDQHLLRQTKQSLMAETEQAVVFVGREGSIIEMNRVAADMLGAEPGRCLEGETPVSITAFALPDDPAAQGLLSSEAGVRRERIELRGAGGQPRSVLATRTDLDPSLDMSIWFFTDIADMKWARDMRFLRETVAEIAEQTRSPLALACSLATQTALLHEDAARGEQSEAILAKAQNLGQRIVAEIGKVDITFERLASANEARRQAPPEHARVALHELLTRVITAFPQRDQGRIAPLAQAGAAGGPMVHADAEALSAAFRSILAYLLRCRSDDARVEVDISDDPDGCSVRLGLSAEQAWDTDQRTHAVPDDALLNAERAAHDGAGLGIAQIVRTMQAHGGMLTTDPPMAESAAPPSQAYESVLPPWRSFTLRFPSRSG